MNPKICDTEGSWQCLTLLTMCLIWLFQRKMHTAAMLPTYYILQAFSFFSPFVISKLVTVCHLLMATNQEFFCRRQLRSMTSCSLPIKLLNCWSLSKDNLPEGKSQDVTMTYNQILHKTEHGINNSIKIEGRYCNEKVKLCAGL